MISKDLACANWIFRAFALLIVPVLYAFEKHQFGVHRNNIYPVLSTLIFLTIAFFLYFGSFLSWYTEICKWFQIALTMFPHNTTPSNVLKKH